MFSYLAKCGWLFDGFISHGQLAVESILQWENSSESDQRSFRERALGPWAAPPGGRGPNIFRAAA